MTKRRHNHKRQLQQDIRKKGKWQGRHPTQAACDVSYKRLLNTYTVQIGSEPPTTQSSYPICSGKLTLQVSSLVAERLVAQVGNGFAPLARLMVLYYKPLVKLFGPRCSFRFGYRGDFKVKLGNHLVIRAALSMLKPQHAASAARAPLSLARSSQQQLSTQPSIPTSQWKTSHV